MPARRIHVIVPFGAGSSTDIVHRVVLEQLSVQLGQPFVVENCVGTGGTVGAAVLANASRDGYMLLGGSADRDLP